MGQPTRHRRQRIYHLHLRYDGTDAAGRQERRGLATKVDITTAGSTWTSTGAYDADGSMTVQKLPGGITQYNDFDNTGEPVGLRYTGQTTTLNDDGTTTVDPNGGWLSWSIDNDVTGRVAREWTPDGAAFTGPAGDAPGDAIPYDRAYTYDNAGRLTQVKDRTAATTGVDITDPTAAPCTTRTYGFDRNDNRLTKTTATSAADGACPTTGGTTTTRTFDTVDRPITGANGTGTYTYDQLGRTTTLPASDTPNPTAGNITLSYYDTDLARTITQSGATTTFTLDALDRRATETVATSTGSTQTVRHYTDTSDNPTWVTDGTTTQRYAELIGDDLALTVDQTGSADLTLVNNHGDVATTIDISAGATPATTITDWDTYDEFGNLPPGGGVHTGPVRYGWLGGKQRAASGAGMLLMGDRLYNPATALFTSLDPVEGGNNNAYTYPNDPINQFDLDGRIAKSELGRYSIVGQGRSRNPRGRPTSRSQERAPKVGKNFYKKRRADFEGRGKRRKFIPNARKPIKEWRHYRSRAAAIRAAVKYAKKHKKFGAVYQCECNMGGHVHVRIIKKGRVVKTIHFHWAGYWGGFKPF